MSTPRDDQMTAHREVLKATYRTFANDFLTTARFAEWLGLDETDARALVDIGRKYQDRDAACSADRSAIAS